MSDEPEGIRYQRTYPFDVHPHIGIIDPRTGLIHKENFPDYRGTSQNLAEDFNARRIYP